MEARTRSFRTPQRDPMSYAKVPAKRNPALLAMAKGKHCLLVVTPFCRGIDGSTTVAAHSNSAAHGKGKSLKADDTYSVWACVVCHTWLDQGDASREEREQAFLVGHQRQLKAWKDIAENIMAKPKEVEAARWALKQF